MRIGVKRGRDNPCTFIEDFDEFVEKLRQVCEAYPEGRPPTITVEIGYDPELIPIKDKNR